MPPILATHTWVSLTNEVRCKIRSLFSIPRSSSTVVNDGVLETDGTTNEDLKHLTIEKMQVYLGDTQTDFHKLFDKVIAKVNDELSAPPISQVPTAFVLPVQVVKKRGRPSKKK